MRFWDVGYDCEWAYSDAYGCSLFECDVVTDLEALNKQPESTTTYPRRPQHDAFSLLSASQPITRPHSQQTVNQTQQPQQRSGNPVAGDAFGSLFTASTGSSPANTGNMTIAERAALMQKMKAQQYESSAWADKLTATTASIPDDFDLAFSSVPTKNTMSSSLMDNHTIDNDDWGLSDFSSPPPVTQSKSPSTAASTAKSASAPKPQTLWDLDDFALPPPSHSQTGTPGDFDFGDREDGLLDDDDSDGEDTFGLRVRANPRTANTQEDDLLGDLGKPVSHSPSPNPPPSTGTPLRPLQRTNSSSPPPHITGQLVEMGFSPQDARSALSSTKTENGFNIQAAAELLLSQGGGRKRDIERQRDRRPRTQGRTRQTPMHSDSQPQMTTNGPSRLISQASEIGRGVFSKANALWKEGRERAVKMYEEKAATVASGSGSATDGRPRWMREGGRDNDSVREPEARGAMKGGFRDVDQDDGQGNDRRERQRPVAGAPPRGSPQPPPTPYQPQPQEVNLFAADVPPSAYQSPFRRGKPKSEPTPPLWAASAQASTSASPPTQPSPPNSGLSPTPPRNLTTTIHASALATSTSHKSTGTQAFKLGDFPSSISSYALALSALPAHHVLRVPILTNLALVKGKVGDLKEAVKDCDEAIRLVRGFVAKSKIIIQGGSTTATTELATSIDLIEGLTKAYRRRAESYEGLEKWEIAQTDWEVLINAEWAAPGVKGEALRGAGRCRKMVEAGGGSTTPSPALTALRALQTTQASEDALRLTHKDSVDARLTSWKAGKEANIRALLTTLDSVLWPELGWKKVGMAEVVGKGQVKGAYVRAIARVHPDKLNANNTTLEQRMIANGVFGALNEAWNAFQQQS
ncbi:hypothetical protein BU15DRAFT_90081 [Melanogaster broomeanus]|nr:hypothetical protein BU15DRAFT_90081 [Melanogaster broomeanus]